MHSGDMTVPSQERSEPRIRPALSPEEWEDRVAERMTDLGHPYAITARGGQLELHGIAGSRPLLDELRAPVAAFSLEGQPFGFWCEDVLDEIEASRHRAELAELAANESTAAALRTQGHRHIRQVLKLAALLPSDAAAEETITSATDVAH